jgi:uncharacterized membrane protein
MLTTKFISSLIGLVLSFPACLVLVYFVVLNVSKALGITQFEGSLAITTIYFTAILSPLLSVLVAFLQFMMTGDKLPAGAIAVEFVLCLIGSVIIFFIVR